MYWVGYFGVEYQNTCSLRNHLTYHPMGCLMGGCAYVLGIYFGVEYRNKTLFEEPLDLLAHGRIMITVISSACDAGLCRAVLSPPGLCHLDCVKQEWSH